MDRARLNLTLPKDGHPMVNSEGKVHLRGWRTHRQIFVQTHRGQYRGLVGRGVRELALFRVR